MKKNFTKILKTYLCYGYLSESEHPVILSEYIYKDQVSVKWTFFSFVGYAMARKKIPQRGSF